ncbi:aldose 1-epimerase [Jiella pacifica]|uniref:Aldose 1-epimerase n=1 Tax=Jiella pacifica TaxID=2696469 RepID=A0A6N9T4Q5_9HYPH|nr:aldose 1-epimerase [Jiella pacifica]NDW06220.1 aldose 1-epimerase [Jiella pacifica]
MTGAMTPPAASNRQPDMAEATEAARTLALTAGELSLNVAPTVGGAIAAFSVGAVPILRRTPPLALAERRAGLCGSYAMIPYSNRIADAAFDFGDERFQLARNFGDNPHSLHGNGWQRAWTVVSAAPDAAVVALDHDPQESAARAAEWPFAYRGEQRFVLTPQGLAVTLCLENRDDRPMPAGFGLHPYFDRPGAYLRFAASRVWQSDGRVLPTGRMTVPQSWDCRTMRRVDGIGAVDHCFEGWDGTAEIAYPERRILIRIKTDPVFGKLVVFRADERDFFAVEPVSHMVDAVNRVETGDHGLRVLAPAERMEGTVRFDIERLP